MRLDKYLVDNKFVKSRERAKNLISTGSVIINGSVVTKTAHVVKEDDVVEVTLADYPWVSRAGLKLEKAFKEWGLNVQGKVCLDIGASTGGFTQVLLKEGAKKVYALDVGHGQLADEILGDERVVSLEGVNIRGVHSNLFQKPISFITADVSFISLEHILPKASKLIEPRGEMVFLVKPQFEVGSNVVKKGVVRLASEQQRALQKIRDLASSLGFVEKGVIESPIPGAEGNKEFLLYLQHSPTN